MDKQEWIGTVVMMVIGITFYFVIAHKYQDQKNEAQEARDHYYECVQKTNDIQWCFINFKPDIK